MDYIRQQFNRYFSNPQVIILIAFLAAGSLLIFALGEIIAPVIAAIVVFFPIAIMAFFQWGWSSEVAYVCSAYLAIQFVDGNILAPLLLSGVVNLHPVAILIAILIFGNLWGLWGVFFAIPLATLVRSIIHAWPEAVTPVAVDPPPRREKAKPVEKDSRKMKNSSSR